MKEINLPIEARTVGLGLLVIGGIVLIGAIYVAWTVVSEATKDL